MRVALVTREYLGVGKVWSGIADAVRGLSRALVEKKQDVTVIMPLGEGNQVISVTENHKYQIKVPFHGKAVSVDVYEVQPKNRAFPSFIFLGLPNVEIVDPFFSGNEAIVEKRFGLFFDRAAVALLERIRDRFDIVHAHTKVDFLAYFAKALGLERPIIYTIHNLEKSEEHSFFSAEFNELIDCQSTKARIDPYAFAMNWSDEIVTVSENYAQELIAGKTLHTEYRTDISVNAKRLTGILNGIDDSFSPDSLYEAKLLPFTFKTTDLKGKERCHLDLQKRLGLPIGVEIPIMLWSQRLVESKGAVEFSGAINAALQLGMQVVIFGSGNQDIEYLFDQKGHNNRERMCIVRFNQFNSSYEPLFIAGSDIVVQPSLEEPCGLLALKAMRLGTLPLVNPVGGLAQIVKDGQNGFYIPKGKSMEDAMGNKLAAIHRLLKSKKGQWQKLIKQAMETDSSWNLPAEKYLAIYQKVIAGKPVK